MTFTRPAAAVVTPLDEHMGLDIARSLGRRGIPVYGIDSNPAAPGKYSKYCQFTVSPCPEGNTELDYVQFLVDFGKKLDKKAVLYPLSDHHVILCSTHRAVLQNYYEFVMPEHTMLVDLTTKNGLQNIAAKFKVASPNTIQITSTDKIDEIARLCSYPVILKPVESTYWHSPEITRLLRQGFLTGRAKVIRCNQPADLIEAYQRIAVYDKRLIVQEVIPGEDSRLFYVPFYLDRQSKPLGVFAGQKLRIIPTEFGSASYVKSYYDPKLVEITLDFLQSVHYQGLGGIEFKKDARDDLYKLIEFNTRFGMWDGLGARCGVDLAYIAYQDALSQAVDPQLTYRQGVTWLDWQRDIRAVLEYRRKGQITLREWLRSLRGEKMWAIYSREDWRPGAAFTISLAGKMWDRMRRSKDKP